MCAPLNKPPQHPRAVRNRLRASLLVQAHLRRGPRCGAALARRPRAPQLPGAAPRDSEPPNRSRSMCTPAPGIKGATASLRDDLRSPLTPGTDERTGWLSGRVSLLSKLSRAPPAHPTVGVSRNDRTSFPLGIRRRTSRSCPRDEKVVGSNPTGGSVCAGQRACCLDGNRIIVARGADNECAAHAQVLAGRAKPLIGMSGPHGVRLHVCAGQRLGGRRDEAQGAAICTEYCTAELHELHHNCTGPLPGACGIMGA